MKSEPLEKLLATHPERAIEIAVKGMLPKNPGPADVQETQGRTRRQASARAAAETVGAIRAWPSKSTTAPAGARPPRLSYLKPGNGDIVVNGRPLDVFFGRETARMIVRQPLVVAEATDRFDVQVTVRGGGTTGQAGAIRHGITRSWTTTRACARLCVRPGSSRAMRARSSARRSVCARRAGGRSTRSASCRLPGRRCNGARRSASVADRSWIGGSSSGRTSDSDSENLGSNPSPATSPLAAGCPYCRTFTPLALPIKKARPPAGSQKFPPSRRPRFG